MSYDKPHRMARGTNAKDGILGNEWYECGCGFAAPNIDDHVKLARELTVVALAELDAFKHISYWCGIHDHCCCTDHDWAICNCHCHVNDSEEQHCHVRLERWRLARQKASSQLLKKGGSSCL
jgi:hypothetical protein